MKLIVTSPTTLECNGKSFRIAIGSGGFVVNKKEGDLATPIGEFALRECWYRADKISKPDTKLPLRIIQQDDGWCDAPDHPNYNRHVKLPFSASHEKLWREDDMYDLIVPLGYNDDPPLAGLGSAIFMHVAKPGYLGTEGCVALAKQDLLELLAQAASSNSILISG